MTVEERVDGLEAMVHSNNKYATKGQGNAGVALGSVGTALGGLSLLGGAGNILGGLWNRGPACNEDHFITRYDASMMKQL